MGEMREKLQSTVSIKNLKFPRSVQKPARKNLKMGGCGLLREIIVY